MWDYEEQVFTYNQEIYECSCDGNVEYQQFTGFKDSKDKEIFEGDILRWEEYQGWEDGRTIEGIYIVQWSEDRGQWMLHDPFENSHREMYDTQYEYVVGNIMENKALLPCEDEVD
jgi:uncharacterized phage protein (TIGR01671 family)